MRILELNFERSWRGGELQTLYEIRGFTNAGHKVTLICRAGAPLAKNARQAGIHVIEKKGVLSIIPFLISSASDFDILHCQSSKLLTYCVLTRWLHRKPVVLNRWVTFVPKGYFSLKKYRAANKIIAVGETVKKVLQSKRINNVLVIRDIAVPQVLNIERAISEIERYKVSGKKIIATTAAMEAEKDPFTMIEAIRLLAEKRNDFIFIHFGSGSLMAAACQKIKDHGLQDIYITAGFKEKVYDFFSLMNVFAFSSIQEGSGSSILDAFMYKVPVASTNGGGLPELVSEDRGLVCEVGNAQALAENISLLMDDNTLRTRLINNAYEYVMSNHGMVEITSQYINEFSKLLHQ